MKRAVAIPTALVPITVQQAAKAAKASPSAAQTLPLAQKQAKPVRQPITPLLLVRIQAQLGQVATIKPLPSVTKPRLQVTKPLHWVPMSMPVAIRLWPSVVMTLIKPLIRMARLTPS